MMNNDCEDGSMTSAIATNKALLEAPKAPKPPASETMVMVARKFGVSPLSQLREMVRLRVGDGKLAPHEYYSTGAFHPEISTKQKREYVGREGSYRLNAAASPLKLTVSRGFVRDKVLYTQLLNSLGIAATETQALVHGARLVGDTPVLRDVAQVRAFFESAARFPIFGKPVEGSGSVGSVLIKDLDASSDLLLLGNGRQIDLASFAQEIIEDYPEGFLLQSAIEQHVDMSRMTGDAVGTLRVVTLRDENGISPLYTIWKIPSPKAMSDNYWQDGSMIADIDDQGRVTRCKRGNGAGMEWIDAHPVSAVRFQGHQIPHWDKLHDAAVAAHGLFPEFGVIGWDIGMSAEGPIIIEANDNPFHALYQLAAGQGIRNPVFLKRFEAAAATSQAILKSRIDVFQARQKAQNA